MKTEKLYPESGVELRPFIARHYDLIMNIGSMGFYSRFIKNAIKSIGIKPTDRILDMGCGTGRNSALMLKHIEAGEILGVDISHYMKKQFEKRFAGDSRVKFLQQRIDIPFDLNRKFDIVFISFVIHGFPHEVRKVILDNAYNHLNPKGRLIILDFAEFNMDAMPKLHRFIFKKIECPYAFDYISRNWIEILNDHGFEYEFEKHYVKNYVRLLSVFKK